MNTPTSKSMMQIFVDDFQIPQSRLITHKCIVAALALLSTLLLLEISIDFKATSVELILPALVSHLFLLFFSIKRKTSINLGAIQALVFYLLIVSHLIIDPLYFHRIVYWMPFIPMQALITKGMKAAKIWFLITVLTMILNGIYGSITIGDTYQFSSGFLEYASVGLIFLLCIFSAFNLLYSLLGDAYGQAKAKSVEIERLNSKLSQMNDSLEDRVTERTKDIEDQRVKLEKIAFMNSHMVRSSLSTIVGAVKVMTIDDEKRDEMIEVIVKSSNDMDSAVRKMGDALSEAH